MAKLYKEGIVSPKGFDMSAGEPVDQREIVQYHSDLLSMKNVFLGLEVKVVEENYTKYKLIALPSSVAANWIKSDVEGPEGPAGPAGADGAEGKSAYQVYLDNGGILGETEWLNSLTGPTGPQGPQGVKGVKGDTGDQGEQGLVGPQGPAGGGITLQGSDTVANILTYDDSVAGLMWIATDSGTDDYSNAVVAGDGLVSDGAGWLNVGPIKGDKGDTGPTGPTGPAGNDGATGATGAIGPEGPQGPQGIQGEQGIQGIQGIQGVQGPAGEDGLDGDLTYVHDQAIPALVWNVTHNLGKKPSVTVIDTADTTMEGKIEYVDNNNVILTFNSSFSGTAIFN